MDRGGPFATKLSRFIPLSVEDVRLLDALCIDEERFEAGADIARQGDVPRSALRAHPRYGMPLPALA